MYLQKLELKGFKSFATKTTLEFNKELTAIVGPNGSGKSNIADAVRWVLGEQSLKVLRGKKSQDVIFSGSDKKARLGMAEVNLYLNNEDGSAPIDYREIVITRRIFRSGESEYLINKNKVRLHDIQMLMAKSSLGQRSYSIVGQGMVDYILTAPPQERKEFFDEATGVRQYQIKREQTLNKLDRTYDNLQQSKQLLKEIEPRLRSLTRQIKRLEEREEIVKELDKLQNKYYGQLHNQLQRNLNKQKRAWQSIETERQILENKLIELQKKLEEIEAEDGRSQTFYRIENKYSKLVNEKNKLLQEISLLQGKIDLKLTIAGKSNVVWLQKKSSDLSIQLTAIKEQLDQAQTNKEKNQGLLDKKLNEQQKIINEFNSIKEKLLSVQKENNGTDNLTGLQDKIIALRDIYQEFLSEFEKINTPEQLAKLKTKANNIASIIKTLSQDLKKAPLIDAQKIIFLEEKMNQFLTTKDNLVDEINELRVNLEVSKTKAEQSNSQYKQVRDEKDKIEIELQIQTADSKDKQQAALQQQKQTLETDLVKIEASLTMAKQQIDEFNSQAEAKQASLINMQKQTREFQIKLDEKNNQINTINIEVAKLETKLEDLNKEISEELGNQWRSSEIDEEVDIETVRNKINSLKNKLAVVGGIDESIPQEYKEVKERFIFLDEQVNDLEQSINSLQETIKELDTKIEQQFKETFNIINEEFKKYFGILFNGGKASLILKQKEESLNEDDEQIEEEKEEESPVKKLKKGLTNTEIEIKASPPGKKIDAINTLSGGEKAMTAIALICAIISANPPPFIILDEVDAALDEANTGRYVAIINELSSKTQFIAITHNRVTMHHAAILYGVTMGDDGLSRLLSVNLKEAEEYSQ